MKTRLTIIGTILAIGFGGLCGETAKAAKKEGEVYPALVAASEIKGTKVHNLQNQDIGYIDEVLIDPRPVRSDSLSSTWAVFWESAGRKSPCRGQRFNSAGKVINRDGSSTPIRSA